MRKYILGQFAVFAVFTALIGMAAFGILLLDFQFPGLFKVWAAPSDEMALNLVLMVLFGLQHSLMARPAFKRVIVVLFPPELERSFYVLMSGFMLLLLAGLWVPTSPPLYDLRGGVWEWPLHLLALGGILVTGYAGMALGGLELLGVRALVQIAKGQPVGDQLPFRVPGLYKWVRHPIYFGLLLCFWATPAMTHDHLLFAEVMTAYILVGAVMEERGLVRQFGDQYRAYQRQVPMLIPSGRRYKGK